MADKDDVDSLNEEISETKSFTRKSRNLSEKKRRDSFNVLITELAGIVSTTNRKLDKSNVLKQTIAFLRKNNHTQADSGNSPDSERFRPPFLTNDEFLYLLLENLEAFVIVIACNEQIIYVSDKLKEFLECPQVDFRGKYLNDILDERSCLSFRNAVTEQMHINPPKNCSEEGLCCFNWSFRKCNSLEEAKVEGKFKSLILPDQTCGQLGLSCVSSDETLCFMGVGKFLRFPLNHCVSLSTNEKLEFVCKFNMEWKFIFVDQRSVNITGYLPFELLGLSGYEYYHIDDLNDITSCHEMIIKNGEATSSPYRFRIKADRWIWIRSHYFVNYHQWNRKPECVVSTNHVILNPVHRYDDGFSVSSSISARSDGKLSSKHKKEPTTVLLSDKEASAVSDHGKQVFRPQPGVCIEHSPISTTTNHKNRENTQRKQKQQQGLPNQQQQQQSSQTQQPSLIHKVIPEAVEDQNAALFEQLLQSQLLQQSNLQQQVLQHERQLKTLQSQLLKSLPPTETMTTQNTAPLYSYSIQRFDSPLTSRDAIHLPSPIRQIPAYSSASVWPAASQPCNSDNNFTGPRLSF